MSMSIKYAEPKPVTPPVEMITLSGHGRTSEDIVFLPHRSNDTCRFPAHRMICHGVINSPAGLMGLDSAREFANAILAMCDEIEGDG